MKENDWAIFMVPSDCWRKFRANSFYDVVDKREKCQLILHQDGPFSIVKVYAPPDTVSHLIIGLIAFQAKDGFEPCIIIDKDGSHNSSGSLFNAPDFKRFIEEVYLKHENIDALKSCNYQIIENASVGYWIGKRGRRIESYSRFYPNWLDHSYFLKDIETGKMKLVGEPYGVCLDELKEIVDFCDKYNLDFEISHGFPSIHYPNNTIALVFSKKEKQDFVSGLREPLPPPPHFLHGVMPQSEENFSKEKKEWCVSSEYDNSHTLYSVLHEAATGEGVVLSDSMREKLAQILIECCQDFFKDWKDKLDLLILSPEKIKSVIIENFERVREWQRWSEQEINDLFYLWKIRQMKVEKIARLMQRSVGSVERMIAFIESDKYMNYANFYKDIRTQVVKDRGD